MSARSPSPSLNNASSSVRGDVAASFISGRGSAGGVSGGIGVVGAGFGSLPERVTTEITVNTTPAMMATRTDQYVLRITCGTLDSLMARRVASHLACSISVFRSPSEIVNLLLISYASRVSQTTRNCCVQTHLDGNIISLLIRPILCFAIIHIHLDATPTASVCLARSYEPRTYSCFNVPISSFNF